MTDIDMLTDDIVGSTPASVEMIEDDPLPANIKFECAMLRALSDALLAPAKLKWVLI